MARVESPEIERFLEDFDAIVDGRKSLRQHNAEAPQEQREANVRGLVRVGAPPKQDEYSSFFDNEEF